MEERKKEPVTGGGSTDRDLLEENKRLREENERLKKLPLKERLYDKINVSVRTLDIVIGSLCVLFVIVVILGMLK
ncbi:MAG: hypothetical protein HFG14_08825 [Lachnospiraceae bacterium]|nr:hypothetical protein [Lachnospiraceae bacterium]NBJ82890.1 hypothetical protein [bacterium 1XD42-76]NBK06181.1 hypothetical protein [bacterium 1XD42-94]